MTRVLLVTGASRGIGAEVARIAARSGWHVIVNYNTSADQASALVADIAAFGGTAEALHGNVADTRDVAAMFSMCRERHGRLDGLVNNAGILPEISRFEDIDPERWQRTFSVNTVGTFLCCREAVRLMSPRHGGQGGAIVNLSSMAAALGAANEFVDYGASKGAVESMTIGLSRELGPDGIRVNAVRPGLIDTEIHGSAGDQSRTQRLIHSVPLGRPGSAAEAGEAVVWLLSEAASYVTGSILSVSGGR
ncbi:SDR family oxidoreductase [Roseovarius sp.]|uniref:SDR family oxidoreductase n=1 Tax=Roseovarius sp. TaxID=1486281 RepID=UPI003562E354